MREKTDLETRGEGNRWEGGEKESEVQPSKERDDKTYCYTAYTLSLFHHLRRRSQLLFC